MGMPKRHPAANSRGRGKLDAQIRASDRRHEPEYELGIGLFLEGRVAIMF